MLLLLIPQGGGGGSGPSGLDLQYALPQVLYRLGFQGLSDVEAASSWVSVAELYQWADEAAKRLSYEVGVFIVLDTSVSVSAGTAAYSLPASHVFTLAVALVAASGVPQILRLTPVKDLWALDANWPASSGAARRCSMDAGAVGTITLYPIPTAGGTLSQICQEFPATIAVGSTVIALSAVLEDYFGYAMLAGARGKESDAAMPEMAKHFGERMKLYEQVMEHLWGPGQ
jgi:hypothetical protein